MTSGRRAIGWLAACLAALGPIAAKANAACERYLEGQEKAAAQWQFEAALLRFEQEVVTWRF